MLVLATVLLQLLAVGAALGPGRAVAGAPRLITCCSWRSGWLRVVLSVVREVRGHHYTGREMLVRVIEYGVDDGWADEGSLYRLITTIMDSAGALALGWLLVRAAVGVQVAWLS